MVIEKWLITTYPPHHHHGNRPVLGKRLRYLIQKQIRYYSIQVLVLTVSDLVFLHQSNSNCSKWLQIFLRNSCSFITLLSRHFGLQRHLSKVTIYNLYYYNWTFVNTFDTCLYLYLLN